MAPQTKSPNHRGAPARFAASRNAKHGRRSEGTCGARAAYIALLHHPVYDKNHQVVTTAVTNMDIHDIAR